MTFTAGSRHGAYEIVGLLGKGGMGEVYRARDTQLQRDVALKLLPDTFASDHDRLARFQREAQLLASLNHPHIAAIYGLEQVSAGALVMELVDGPTLEERIASGLIPVEEAVVIARQLAEALEYAHEKGVIHRDLKPANIKFTVDGKVKVLDFGLAKAMSAETNSGTVSNSPTISLAATQAGIILGTAAYMSPEQAKGKSVDRRADIWAFGVVLYEMLTGRMMFSGETVSETMAQVMMKEPDWTLLPPATPLRLRELLERCLVKDPRNRMRDIGDARIAIEQIIAHPETETPQIQPAAPPVQSRRFRLLLWAAAIAALALAAIMAWAPWRVAPRPQVMRLSLDLGADATPITGAATVGDALALSPDGTVLAFVAAKAGGPPQIYVRRLDQLQATMLPGTDGAGAPFFSPDGQWIAFFSDGRLKKISVTGGAPVTLCDAPDNRGGSWADDGSIIFAPNNRSPLFRVSSSGGKPDAVTRLDDGYLTHRYPYVLPGGRAVLFTASKTGGESEGADIAVQPLPSGRQKVVHQGGYFPRFFGNHLLYVQQGTVFAAPFDVSRLELLTEPAPVLENVMSASNTAYSEFAFSAGGSLVYLPGDRPNAVSVYWMRNDGKTEPMRPPPGNYSNLSFSPDGTLIALSVGEGGSSDIWSYDWARDTMSRLTSNTAFDRNPVWTPDGRRVSFDSPRGGPFNIYWQRADGTGGEQRLTESKNVQYAWSWHPSGRFLAFGELSPQTNYDILILPMEGDETSGWKPGKPTVFLATPFTEENAAFSPDGKWLAYDSTESGRNEIYVRPFPGPGGKWQVSTGGGEYPTWSRNGKDLFYRTPDQRIMVASYTTQLDTFRADKPRLWSEEEFTDRGPRVRNFDLHPDGQRFAVLKALPSETQAGRVVFITNFFDGLRK
jgi:Tol biopolymer transport system component